MDSSRFGVQWEHQLESRLISVLMLGEVGCWVDCVTFTYHDWPVTDYCRLYKNYLIEIFAISVFSDKAVLVLNTIDTILSAFGFICNAAAFLVFVKARETFGYPIR